MKKLKCSGSGTFECNLHLEYDKLCVHQHEHDKQADCKCEGQILPCRNYKCVSIVDIRKEKLEKINKI